jgi:hypothetical protein
VELSRIAMPAAAPISTGHAHADASGIAFPTTIAQDRGQRMFVLYMFTGAFDLVVTLIGGYAIGLC